MPHPTFTKTSHRVILHNITVDIRYFCSIFSLADVNISCLKPSSATNSLQSAFELMRSRYLGFIFTLAINYHNFSLPFMILISYARGKYFSLFDRRKYQSFIKFFSVLLSF